MWWLSLYGVRRLTDQEGQKLQQIVRRGSTSSVRRRRRRPRRLHPTGRTQPQPVTPTPESTTTGSRTPTTRSTTPTNPTAVVGALDDSTVSLGNGCLTPSVRRTPEPSSRPTPTSPHPRPAKSLHPASLSSTECHLTTESYLSLGDTSEVSQKARWTASRKCVT
ncbi:hypothetical protein SAM9427_30450 [Streptomyces sp. ETH9427]|nr:hypothetical protein SAM9427_30450 [Streptomyces sp. ETH9427]